MSQLPVISYLETIPSGTSGKESTCKCRRCKRLGFNPWLGKIPWSRKWQPTPVFLPGKCHGQKNVAGYSSWGHRAGTRLSDWAPTVDYNVVLVSAVHKYTNPLSSGLSHIGHHRALSSSPYAISALHSSLCLNSILLDGYTAFCLSIHH